MRFARYLAVQIAAYGVDLGCFLLGTTSGFGALGSNAFGKTIAGLFAFIVHRGFTFGLAREHHRLSQAARYFGLLALNIPVSSLLLRAVLNAGVSATVAKVAADVLCVLLTYWISKKFVFAGIPKRSELLRKLRELGR